MRSADKDEVPKKRNHKSVPYGAGKERRLSQAGKVKKVLQNETLEGSLETPTLRRTSVMWTKPRCFQKSKPNLWPTSFQKSKPNLAMQRKKSTWIRKSLNGQISNVLNFILILQTTTSP